MSLIVLLRVPLVIILLLCVILHFLIIILNILLVLLIAMIIFNPLSFLLEMIILTFLLLLRTKGGRAGSNRGRGREPTLNPHGPGATMAVSGHKEAQATAEDERTHKGTHCKHTRATRRPGLYDYPQKARP